MAFEYAVVLTGSIATGKSTVAKFFSMFGFTVIDADTIAHQVLDREHEAIAALFGADVVKRQKVKRKKLGKIVFKDKKKRKQLESLVHPLIYEEIERLAKEEDRYGKPYLVDIPLFFETNRYPIKKSIVVYTSEEVQLQRLIQRDVCSPKAAKKRFKTQMSIEEKRQKASYVIDNMGDLHQLKAECERVKEQILGDFT